MSVVKRVALLLKSMIIKGRIPKEMKYTCGYCYCFEEEGKAQAFFKQAVNLLNQAREARNPPGYDWGYDIVLTRNDMQITSPYTVLVSTSGVEHMH